MIERFITSQSTEGATDHIFDLYSTNGSHSSASPRAMLTVLILYGAVWLEILVCWYKNAQSLIFND